MLLVSILEMMNSAKVSLFNSVEPIPQREAQIQRGKKKTQRKPSYSHLQRKKDSKWLADIPTPPYLLLFMAANYAPLPFRDSLETSKQISNNSPRPLKEEDSGPPEIPLEEIVFDEEKDFLGEGAFGRVYSGWKSLVFIFI